MRTYVILMAQSDRYGIKTCLVDENEFERDGEMEHYFESPDLYESIEKVGEIEIEGDVDQLDEVYLSS